MRADPGRGWGGGGQWQFGESNHLPGKICKSSQADNLATPPGEWSQSIISKDQCELGCEMPDW